MHLRIEHLTHDMLALSCGDTFLASVEIINPEVLVAARSLDHCFLIMPAPGVSYSMSTLADRDEVKLEVDSKLQAIVHLRARNVAVSFMSKMFTIRVY